MASEVIGDLTTGVSSSNIQGTVIVAPTASPVAGSYSSAQSVTLSATDATSIHYTTDGTSPTCSTGSTYASAISVGSTLTIKAISCYANSNTSSVSSHTYTITIAGGSGSSGGGGGGSAVVASTKSADTNNDGKVDKFDFALLMSNWGVIGTTIGSDLNSDGKVDKYDFALLMSKWSV